MRDFCEAGVGLDFIEVAERLLLPGRLALVAEVEEEWAAAASSLDAAVDRAKLRVDTLKQEADGKAATLMARSSQVKGDVKRRIEDRVQRVKGAYHARGAKLLQVWRLAREALAV